MRVAWILPGGVDPSGEYRVIPCFLWLLERVARQHDVHVVALFQDPSPSRYRLLGATVDNIGRPWTRLRTLPAIVAEHRRSPFDVFHAFWAAPAGVLAVAAGRLLRRPVVLHLGGGELVWLPEIAYGGLRTVRSRLWVRLALKGATRVTAASQPILERAARLGCQAERLPLGVDLARWPPQGPRARSPGSPARLLHVGSLNPVKDQRTLVRAAALLSQQGVRFHLDVVGEDTMAGAIQFLARELGMTSHVTFHGFLPHRQLRPLFERSDLLLVTSRHEAGPLVVLEAAVAGVPTVGTAVGHLCEWAREAAVTVGVGDAAGLARETAALLDNESRRLHLARAAQARAIREDANWTARQVLRTYVEITGAGRSSGGPAMATTTTGSGAPPSGGSPAGSV